MSEIERQAGFTNVNGEAITYESANQAFNAFLNATGEKLTKAQKNQKFKDWLAKNKASGQLDKLVKSAKDKAQAAIDKTKAQVIEKTTAADQAVQAEIDKSAPDEKKPMKIMGLPPMAAIGIAVAIIGLVSYGIYAYQKGKKKAA